MIETTLSNFLNYNYIFRKCSLFFGLSALVWSLSILYHGLRTENFHEIWNFVALFLWLFANFWWQIFWTEYYTPFFTVTTHRWMIGEAHDYEFPFKSPVSDAHATTSTLLLNCALCWLVFYYVVILPFNLFPSSKSSLVIALSIINILILITLSF